MGRASRPILLAVAVLTLTTLVMRRRGFMIGWDTVVRCRAGHLFTTIWLPGVSLKSLRLEPLIWKRFQYCPVGRHWTVVTPVQNASLSEEERLAAALARDVRLP